jgi:flagellin FlaB
LKNNTFGKFAKALANMHNQRGMTGLETAIILIAFVTVAAVFGYAVLSAGLFSAERGKETIYAGLQQAKANMEISGSVIVYGDNNTSPPTQATKILFTVRNAIAGTPIDMTANAGGDENRCIISLTTADAYYNNVEWSVQKIGNADGDDLLEAGEQFEITLDLTDLGGTFADPAIGVNDWFNIQVKPTQGSTMTIQRTLPAGLDDIMDMH